MKVIDLLNKIAKGEEVPNRFIYNKKLYEKNLDSYYRYYEAGCGYASEKDFITEINENFNNLNDEVEIIEENKKIEKIDFRTLNTQKEKNRVMKDTINQIIDKLNERDEDV